MYLFEQNVVKLFDFINTLLLNILGWLLGLIYECRVSLRFLHVLKSTPFLKFRSIMNV